MSEGRFSPHLILGLLSLQLVKIHVANNHSLKEKFKSSNNLLITGLILFALAIYTCICKFYIYVSHKSFWSGLIMAYKQEVVISTDIERFEHRS